MPDVENLWAPEVYEHDGTWYLYYSASTFGSNRSAIGLLTATTLDPEDPAYGWTDRGEVVRSEPGRDDWNAIDPGIARGRRRRPVDGVRVVLGRHPAGPARVAERPVADPDAEP